MTFSQASPGRRWPLRRGDQAQQAHHIGTVRSRGLGATRAPVRPHGILLLLFLLLLHAAVPAQAGLETALEKMIGRQAATALAEAYGTEADPVLADWVRRISERVSAASPRQDVHYRVQIIDMAEPNAMALPGGYIFVTKGLLEFVDDDDELAAILAHEVGHVAGRHGIRHLERQIIAGLLISAVQDRAGETAALAASLMDVLFTLQRSRHDELASDQMAAEYASRAGYDPAGLLAFFRRIQPKRKASWMEGFFATHPLPGVRMERLKSGSAYFKEPQPELLMAIGDRLASEGRYNRALEKYRAAAERKPEWPDLSQKMAEALLAQGKRPEAEAMLLKAKLPAPSPVKAMAPATANVPIDSALSRQALSATLRDLGERQKTMNDANQRLGKDMNRAWRRHKWTQRLQTTLVGAPAGMDYRWAYLVTHCAMLSSEVDRQLNEVWRVMRVAPAAAKRASALCTQANAETAITPALLSSIADEVDRAGKESLRGLEGAAKALPEIEEADRLIAGVLADLNSPYVLRWSGGLGHVAILEGFLQHAGRCLDRADTGLRTASRDAARSRARVERTAIDVAATGASPAERAVFRTLLRARLNVTEEQLSDLLSRGYPLGDAAVMLLYTRSTSQPVSRLEAEHGGAATWIDTAERLGLAPDVQAIVLRMLHNTIVEERIRG